MPATIVPITRSNNIKKQGHLTNGYLMKTKEHFEKLIVEKALKDDAFRAELPANPKLTIEKEPGIKIPEICTSIYPCFR